MIQHDFNCLDGVLKRTKDVHNHQVLWYRISTKKNTVLACILQDEEDGNNTTWSILLAGFVETLNDAITEDQAKDMIEQRMVELETSPVYQGVFIPRIPVVK